MEGRPEVRHRPRRFLPLARHSEGPTSHAWLPQHTKVPFCNTHQACLLDGCQLSRVHAAWPARRPPRHNLIHSGQAVDLIKQSLPPLLVQLQLQGR